MKNVPMRAGLLVMALLALPGLSWAQRQVGGKISDLKSKILDLNFRVQDMGGKVQDLDIKETPTEVRIELAADVLFDFDKADLLPNARQTLEKAAQIIRDRAKGEVRIEGYTDAKGSDAYNQKLSERRAEAVKAWFVNQGNIRNVKFVTQGLGAKNPVAPNTKPDGSDDPDGRQKNRRVEITIRK
jgi:outer membrane protein OmpA-like peptidoglycan-associated protein